MSRSRLFLFLFLVCIPFLEAAETPLIPRKILFGNPVKDKPMISPGGTRIAYLAPSKDGVMNIWVKTLGKEDDRMVTNDTRAGIFYFTWGYSDDHVLFFQDNLGDENEHLKSVDLRTQNVRDLTPFQDVRATNLLKDDLHPEEVLIGLNLRDRKLFDMYRVNLLTGALKLEAENPGDIIGWATDTDFRIRAATAFREDLSTVIRVRDAVDRPWRDLLVTPFERTPFLGQYNGGSLVTSFSKDGKSLYVATSINSDTTQVVGLNVNDGKILEVLAQHPKADLWENGDHYEVLVDKKTGQPQAAVFDYLKLEYHLIDQSLAPDFEVLKKQESGVFKILSRTADDSVWIAEYVSDHKPRVYYLYDRKQKKATMLFNAFPELYKLEMARRESIVIPASDGFELVSYLTVPPGVEKKNLPFVLLVHGGPWYRDKWEFDPEVQWLANRGYAVLQVNFRGSAGFGLKYMNAGTGQWCTGAMQQDLTDSVKWAIKQGIADPKRVLIYGGSYGGYATLCGVTFTPDLYVAGIDLVGPSDVGYLLRSFPEYWKPVKKRWVRRIGVDAERDEGGNRRISPLYHTEKIRVPLLIAHGANDPRVKQEASDRIVEALSAKGLPVTYLVYPDEGHGFYREPNILDFYGRAEEFLSKMLKGRYEPRTEIAGTSVQIRKQAGPAPSSSSK